MTPVFPGKIFLLLRRSFAGTGFLCSNKFGSGSFPDLFICKILLSLVSGMLLQDIICFDYLFLMNSQFLKTRRRRFSEMKLFGGHQCRQKAEKGKTRAERPDRIGAGEKREGRNDFGKLNCLHFFKKMV